MGKNLNQKKDYYWLKCEVSEGMFADREYAVETQTIRGNPVSMFVPIEYVRKDDSLVSVEVLEKRVNSILILLPSEPLQGYSPSKIIEVSPKEIVSYTI